MWFPILLVAALFVALAAICYFGMDRNDPRFAEDCAPGSPGCCGECHSPLPKSATRDQVVFEVERRIDAELQAIARGAYEQPARGTATT